MKQPPAQEEFDLTIGRLDRALSLMVNWAKDCDDVTKDTNEVIDPPNQQTLKHHAEDMIAAGQKILKCLGHVVGTSQPEVKEPK